RRRTVSPPIKDAKAEPGEQRKRDHEQVNPAGGWPDPAGQIEQNNRAVENDKSDVEDFVHTPLTLNVPLPVPTRPPDPHAYFRGDFQCARAAATQSRGSESVTHDRKDALARSHWPRKGAG